MWKKIDFLTFEEEIEAIKQYQKNGCDKSLSKLIKSNYPLICSLARKKSNYVSVMYEDLVQEGTIGLINAIKKYDLDSGNRLNTYAKFYIENGMFEYILKHSNLVKFSETKTNKKIFFNIGKYRNSDGVLTMNAVEKMASDLNVPEKEILEMNSHLNASYFDCSEHDDLSDYSLGDSYYEPNEFLERCEKSYLSNEILNTGLDKIGGRMSEVIKRRYLNSKLDTLADIAKDYKITPERVRQIETSAIKALQKEILGMKYFS